MAISLILGVSAIICFVLAAFGVASRVSLTDIGLACLTGALLFV